MELTTCPLYPLERDKTPPHVTVVFCVLYLIVKPQAWRSEECEELYHSHYSQSMNTCKDPICMLKKSLFAQSAGAIEYTTPLQRGKTPPNEYPDIWHYRIWWWGSSNAGALGNAKYSFIVIAPRSYLARSCSN